jgi:hypothetical protein
MKEKFLKHGMSHTSPNTQQNNILYANILSWSKIVAGIDDVGLHLKKNKDENTCSGFDGCNDRCGDYSVYMVGAL